MVGPAEKRYRIAEVSEMTGVPASRLRQWEERFPALRPPRDRQDRRYYRRSDIALVQLIQRLVADETLTTDGINERLRQELAQEGPPANRREARALLDRIEQEITALLDQLRDDLRNIANRDNT